MCIRDREKNVDSSVVLCQSRRVQENGTGQILKAMSRDGNKKGIIVCYHKNPAEESQCADVVAKAMKIFKEFGLEIEVRLLPSYDLY